MEALSCHQKKKKGWIRLQKIIRFRW